MKNNLCDIQAHLQNYLLRADPKIQHYIVSTEKVPAQLRLDIYANAYRLRLLDALASTYPVLNLMLGDEDFAQLGYDYIDQFPSHHKSIRWFGDQLSTFLNQQPMYQQAGYVAELALIEWTMSLAFDAADSPVLSLETIAKIPPEDWAGMKLYPHPSVQRIKLTWNAIQIWQAITDKQIVPEPAPSPSPIEWLFWRYQLTNQFCSLVESEAWAIDSMLNGCPFGEICEGLCQWVNEQEAGLYAATLLKGWITAGIIKHVELS